MNATEAINRIAELLNLKFKSEKFFVTKLVDGSTEVTNNHEGPFTIGDDLFVVEDSILKPAPAGTHETREGIILTVGPDSKIVKIEEREAEEVESPINEAERQIEVDTETMSSATLADGRKIETDEEGEFEVGQKLYVITEDGERVPYTEAGEHTTTSGIVLTVNSDAIITGVKYPDQDGEGSLEEYRKNMEDMKKAMSEMLSMMNKFSKELDGFQKDYSEFKKQPNFEQPVVKKTFGKENLIDAKYRLLMDAMGKK